MHNPRLMQVILEGKRLLQAKRVESARLESDLLMCHCLGCDRHHLYLSPIEELTADTLEDYKGLLERRLGGEPIQYIIGNRDFMGLNFDVDRNVLIPRWETEILVEFITKEPSKGPINLLDLGTGSGAIGVSLAFYLPKSKVIAVDISDRALEVAKANASKHVVSDRIELIAGDMFSALEDDLHLNYFDIIVSNPPYIKSQEIGNLMREVKEHEPKTALDGGPDGLHFYRIIADVAHDYLKPAGMVAVEMGHGQSAQVQDIFSKTGKYCNVHILKDLSGIDRHAVFYKANKG
ncbi:MAG TPA: peptide chain release factor N(5)-glutamine methyltransferase [Bacillota bacterium]|nr:peptide chain release factor N(5)-glutamine methyltransferase [Bacillota bacterium]